MSKKFTQQELPDYVADLLMRFDNASKVIQSQFSLMSQIGCDTALRNYSNRPAICTK